MASKKLQKYCRIYQWVETQDAKLAGAIRDLCMEGALSASRQDGTTFLYPTAAVRKEIVTAAYSDTPEQAIKLLEAHIISNAVRSGADFREGVGTRLGIKLEADSISGDSVVLKGGAKLELAKDFRPLRKDNIAVWTVETGAVPLEGPAFIKTDRRGRGKVGGSDGSLSDTNMRARLAIAVEAEYEACQIKDRCRGRDPYLEYSVALLNFLRLNYSDLLLMVLPMIDRDPVATFYILIEPYKSSGSDYVLGDSILFGLKGWNGALIYEDALSEYKSFFEILKTQTTPSALDRSSGKAVVPWVSRDVASIRSAVDTTRLSMLGEDGRKGNRVSVPTAVRAAYATLSSKNTIGGLQPILPDATVQAFRDPAKKLWQDELRFVIHSSMQTVRNMPMYERSSFTKIVQMVRFLRPGNDYSAEASLSDPEALRSNVAPTAEYLLLVKFVNSTEFLYIPVCEADIVKSWNDVPIKGGKEVLHDSSDLSIYNAEQSKHRLHQRYAALGFNTPRQLDAGVIAAIRHYVAVHKTLPPGLTEAVQKAPTP